MQMHLKCVLSLYIRCLWVETAPTLKLQPFFCLFLWKHLAQQILDQGWVSKCQSDESFHVFIPLSLFVRQPSVRLPSVRLSASQSICLSFCLFVRQPFVRPSAVRPSIVSQSICLFFYPSVRPSIRPPVRLSIRPSVHPSTCLSIRLCLSQILSICLYFFLTPFALSASFFSFYAYLSGLLFNL
jgi:hypothetical protein